MSAEVFQKVAWTADALEARVVRYRDLKPCYNAFIDTRSPGSEAKENFTIIGPGVSENPDQHVHIAEPHGFNIGGARQPPGCVNSQHSHDTAEVFLVHSGTWRFDLGEHGDDAQVICHPGDIISLPTQMFRGFTNVGDDTGFLWAVLGGDDPGRVMWAPDVFDMAANYGLVLLENGSLVDTVAGQVVPDDARRMPVTTAAEVAALRRASPENAETLVVRNQMGDGPIIGRDAPLFWPHGFAMDRYDVSGTAKLRAARTVVFVHRGDVNIDGAGADIHLSAGDTASLPANYGPARLNSADATVFAVRAI